MIARRSDMRDFHLTFTKDGKELSIAAADTTPEAEKALDFKDAPLFKYTAAESVKAEVLEGKIVLVQVRDYYRSRGFLRTTHPALMILIARNGDGAGETDLIDPTEPVKRTPRLIVASSKLAEFYEGLSAGETSAAVSLHVNAPSDENIKLRNVIGVLRGSDPVLKDTFVVVSAHYDHLGMKPAGEGDRIYNGANDDGSGTVSMIETAGALASLHTHPRRTIVFIAFFGEEEGLIGSEYYVHHPVFPLAKTIADVEFEQLGRTEAAEGRQIGAVKPTGYAYSTLTDVFRTAGQATGIKVRDAGGSSETYFAQSDNYSFAEAGVPAHTFCVAFQFPDYHGVGDEWQKIDYDNMAKVDRMLTFGVFLTADDPQPPHWNESNPKVKRFADAAKPKRT